MLVVFFFFFFFKQKTAYDIRISDWSSDVCSSDLKLVEFSLIVSTLHRVWAETVSGKLGNGIRYGNTVVYNTFPGPKPTEQNKVDLTRCAEDILLAREAHFPKTIAELYDPEKMPETLRHAHDRNNEVLERIYIGRRFKDRQRHS